MHRARPQWRAGAGMPTTLARMPATSLRSRAPLSEGADLQDGVVSRHQLHERGYDKDAIRANVAAQRWQAIGRKVVVLHNGPLTPRQREWVAVIGQRDAALAGLTAAAGFGLRGFDDDAVHILIPHGTRRHALPGVKLHVSRHFSATDLHPARALPTVRVERALTDAAAWTTSERKACGILAAGVQQRLTTAARLRLELEARPYARHHLLLTHVVGDIEGGAHSFGEIDLSRLARRAGLPPPRRQVMRKDRAGKRRWLDAYFDGFSVEVDGALHLRPISYWGDMERHNDLVIVTGEPILRFSTIAFRTAEATVVAQLAAAAERFGRRPGVGRRSAG